DPKAPLVTIFGDFGMNTAKWIVSIGALFGFSASLFGAILPMPRVIYAMAEDGILFRFLSRIHKRFKTPAIATMLSGLLAGLMAMFFNLESLVDMMSIGTLLAYTIVALSVIMLRYGEDDETEPKTLIESEEKNFKSNSGSSLYTVKDYFEQVFNFRRVNEPSDLTSSLVSYATLAFCILSTILGLLLVVLQKRLSRGEIGAIIGIASVALLAFINIIIIACQPQANRKLPFKVPFVPWIPALSTVINLYLMFNLSSATWIRFGVWMGIGLFMYFGYGIWHSNQGIMRQKKVEHSSGSASQGDLNTDHHFDIPDIRVLPPTPLPSAPNTPKVKQNIEIYADLKFYTLSEDEIQREEQLVDKKKMYGNSDDDVEFVLASLDMVIENERSHQSDSDASTCTSSTEFRGLQYRGNIESIENVQDRGLPPLPTKANYDTTAEKENDSTSDPGYEPLKFTLDKKEGIANEDMDSNGVLNDPGYETLEDVQNKKVALSEYISEACDVDGTVITSTEHNDEVPNIIYNISESKASKPLEPSYSLVKKKPKLIPFVMPHSSFTSKNRDGDKPLFGDSHPDSANDSMSASPSPPSIMLSSSEGEKLPYKRRNSSFDSIPPSSPESPLAQCLGDKFVIIPVSEPDDTLLNNEKEDARNEYEDIIAQSESNYTESEEGFVMKRNDSGSEHRFGDKGSTFKGEGKVSETDSVSEEKLLAICKYSKSEEDQVKLSKALEMNEISGNKQIYHYNEIEKVARDNPAYFKNAYRTEHDSEGEETLDAKLREIDSKQLKKSVDTEEAQANEIEMEDFDCEDNKNKELRSDDDSLERALANVNLIDFINFLPSPTISGQTREFKRMNATEEKIVEKLVTVSEEHEPEVCCSDGTLEESITVKRENSTGISPKRETSYQDVNAAEFQEKTCFPKSLDMSSNTEILRSPQNIKKEISNPYDSGDVYSNEREASKYNNMNLMVDENIKTPLVDFEGPSVNVKNLRSLFGD
ncbi:High affinity cationic amino acid transporter 1, partial [Halocaridina rubra]